MSHLGSLGPATGRDMAARSARHHSLAGQRNARSAARVNGLRTLLAFSSNVAAAAAGWRTRYGTCRAAPLGVTRAASSRRSSDHGPFVLDHRRRPAAGRGQRHPHLRCRRCPASAWSSARSGRARRSGCCPPISTLTCAQPGVEPSRHQLELHRDLRARPGTARRGSRLARWNSRQRAGRQAELGVVARPASARAWSWYRPATSGIWSKNWSHQPARARADG